MIRVENLTKTFPGGVRAVDGISFTVEEGEIFGFLGPNGAGKSTTMAILTTLMEPSGGRAWVGGMDIEKEPYRVRQAIGYVSQDLAVDDALTGYENLRLQAGFYHIPGREAEERIAEVLAMVDLKDRARDPVETYSGGMRKRLDIACGLMHKPRLLFLDEPTLGLDIQTRREIWKYIGRLREEMKMTIFFTTHYMDEADNLCDRIAIIDRGIICALDNPSALKGSLGPGKVELSFSRGTREEMETALDRIQGLDFVEEIISKEERDYTVLVNIGKASVPCLCEAVHGLDVDISAISYKEPLLDDVFLHYTGQRIREAGGDREDAFRTRMALRRARR